MAKMFWRLCPLDTAKVCSCEELWVEQKCGDSCHFTIEKCHWRPFTRDGLTWLSSGQLLQVIVDQIRRCDFKILCATAEKVKEKVNSQIIINPNSNLYRTISAVVVDEIHTVETWNGKSKEANAQCLATSTENDSDWNKVGVPKFFAKFGFWKFRKWTSKQTS